MAFHSATVTEIEVSSNVIFIVPKPHVPFGELLCPLNFHQIVSGPSGHAGKQTMVDRQIIDKTRLDSLQ